MNCYKKILDDMVWSFSRIHLYESCPYAFYIKYIEENLGRGNFYAENGSAMHKVFELLAKGELSLDDAPVYYQEMFDEIIPTVKESTVENTFNKCIDYLCELELDFLEQYEIVAVEKHVTFKIGRKRFQGFIDLLLRDKESGDYIIVDHKAADHFLKKNGDVLKNQQDNFYNYSHQMYLYSKAIYEEYGRFPKKIVWHHFKDGGQLTVIDFDESAYEETLKWAKKLLSKISRDETFKAKESYMTCNHLCEFRSDCEYKTSYID